VLVNVKRKSVERVAETSVAQLVPIPATDGVSVCGTILNEKAVLPVNKKRVTMEMEEGRKTLYCQAEYIN
jgi:hypothetical protein